MTRSAWISTASEFLVHRLLRNSLESGDLFVRDSNEFRRFADDLISDERWQNKEGGGVKRRLMRLSC